MKCVYRIVQNGNGIYRIEVRFPEGRPWKVARGTSDFMTLEAARAYVSKLIAADEAYYRATTWTEVEQIPVW